MPSGTCLAHPSKEFRESRAFERALFKKGARRPTIAHALRRANPVGGPESTRCNVLRT